MWINSCCIYQRNKNAAYVFDINSNQKSRNFFPSVSSTSTGLKMNKKKIKSLFLVQNYCKHIAEFNGSNLMLRIMKSSWFGAQKFCHSKGWILGDVADEKEWQSMMRNLIGSYSLVSLWPSQMMNKFRCWWVVERCEREQLCVKRRHVFIRGKLSSRMCSPASQAGHFMEKGCLIYSGYENAKSISHIFCSERWLL